MDVVLYIWDQFMIGLDAPSFHGEFLPVISAIFLMLLGAKIRETTTVSLSMRNTIL